MKKRLLSILLIVCLCAAVLPTFAAAETSTATGSGTESEPWLLTQASFGSATTDSSPVALTSYVHYTLASGYYRLDGDINLSDWIEILGNANITLDLNGHVLASSSALLSLSNSEKDGESITLTLTDSSTEGNGALKTTGTGNVISASGQYTSATINANGGCAFGKVVLNPKSKLTHEDGKPVTVFYGSRHSEVISYICFVGYDNIWNIDGATAVTFKDGNETYVTAYVKGTNKLYLPPKDDPKKDGSIFTGWYAKDSTTPWDFKNDTFDGAFTLYAGWVSSTHKVTFDPNGGSAVTYSGTVDHNSKLTKPTDPTREGYEFAGWFTDLNFENEWKFETDTVTADVILTAKWDREPEEEEKPNADGLGGLIVILDDVPFVDVSANHYFYDAVKWAYHNGVTGGTDAWHFSPDAGCTRAQIVTFLWRAAGCPSATYLGNFSDVNVDAYYATAVAWAVENGITNGTSTTTFSPEAVCTRADAVTFLYRAFGKNPNYTASFSDVPADAYFADAVAWAAENNVTGGTGNGKFSPNDTCSRAQIVTFLYRTLG